jgi:hypothetical protein
MPTARTDGLHKSNCRQQDQFFEASSIRVFRGGEGPFILKLNHNWIIEKVDRGLGAVYNDVKRINATESLKLW